MTKQIDCNGKSDEKKVERYLFLYLNTGSGHLAPAKILKDYIQTNTPHSVCLLNGFAPYQVLAKGIFESFYHLMASFMQSLYTFVFEFTSIPPILALCKWGCTVVTHRYLLHIIKKERITKVVSFHFALNPACKKAITKSGQNIPFITLVTDPFTAHPAWWLVKDAYYALYSLQLKEIAVKRYGINENKICIVPFLFDKRFECQNNPPQVDAHGAKNFTQNDDVIKEKIARAIPINNRVILIAGGGEGLPHINKIVKTFAQKKLQNITIIAVCGRNKTSFAYLQNFALLHPEFSLIVTPFVHDMHALVHIADCVITKAGASMMMQVLAAKKPLIFSTFLHGQEKGNVDFVLQNGVGFYCKKIDDACKIAINLCKDDDLRVQMQKKLDNLNITSDVQKIYQYIEAINE